MGADRRRKQLSGANFVGCSPREQRTTSRKNTGVMQTGMNMKSHISVEWDGHQKKVIAKREQIGISWKNMSPFVNSPHHDHNVLADVYTVPTKIFELDSLRDVLSYEVWQIYLTENERNRLSQFLPRDLDPDQVVQELLDGDNFHFGNPFLEWSASVCSGDFHPDAIVLQEQCSKSSKKLHYSELHRYHNNMIKFLMELKARWESCKDPEKDVVQKLWRSRNEEKIFSHLHESRLFDPEEDVSCTSESGSWPIDERACSSDNQISSLTKSEKLKKRISGKETVRSNGRSSLFSLDDTLNLVSRSMEGDKLHKRNITGDGAKYLSYIKVTRRQLELVHSMKKAGQSIHSKSLHHILGNLDRLHVQPYEVFVEEEQKNMRDYWSHLVNKDVPSAYTFWRERQMQIERMKNLMEKEMLHKLKPLMENEKIVSTGSDLQGPGDDEEIDEESSEGEDEVSSGPGFLENQSSGKITLPSTGDDFTRMSSNPEKKNDMSRSEDTELTNIKCASNLNGSDIPVSQEMPMSSRDALWQSVGMPHSYCDSILNYDYLPAGLSNVNPQINEEQQSQLIDLETDLCEEDSGEELLHGHSADGPFRSYADREQNDILQSQHKHKDILQSQHEQKQILQSHREENMLQSHRDLDNSCQPHQGRNALLQSHQVHSHLPHSHQNQHYLVETQLNQKDLLHSLLKGPGMLPRHEQTRGGLNFQTHNDFTTKDAHFTDHFKEPLQPSLTLEQGQERPIYLGEQMSDNVYTDGSRYLLPGQGNNVPDWGVAGVRIPTPSQPQLGSAEYLGQHLFPADQVRGGWTGSLGASLPSQNIGIGASSDQVLSSVFSQYSQLRSSTAYNPVRPSDLFMIPRTSYSLVDTMPPTINPVVPQTNLPLGFLRGHDAANSLVPDEMSWMSLPPQNPALHDQMGKPFLRSWTR